MKHIETRYAKSEIFYSIDWIDPFHSLLNEFHFDFNWSKNFYQNERFIKRKRKKKIVNSCCEFLSEIG